MNNERRAPKMGLPRAVVDIDEFVESKNVLIYGDTGVGKTEIVGHLPGRVLVLASEDNVRVIRRAAKRFGESDESIKERFKVWPIRSADDLDAAYNWLHDNPDHGFDWAAIDSATSVEQRIMRAAMEKAVRKSPEKRDVDLPDRPEHLKRQMAMRRIITDFNELPVNVMWIAQAMRRENADGDEIVLPFITGKDYEISAWACAQMQAFGYYCKVPSKEVKGQTDRLLTFSSFTDSTNVEYWAKDRYDVLPKRTIMAKGDEQKANFSDFLALIDNDPSAQAEAKRKVAERDDRPAAEDQPQQTEALTPQPGRTDDEAEQAGEVAAPLHTVADEEPDGPQETEEQQHLKTLLGGMDREHLKAAADEVKVAVSGKKRSEIVQAIVDAGWTPSEEGADDDEDDLFAEEPEGEKGTDEPEPEPVKEVPPFDGEARLEALKALPAGDLKGILEGLGVFDQAKGKKKSEVLTLIVDTERANHESAPAGSDEGGFRAADED